MTTDTKTTIDHNRTVTVEYSRCGTLFSNRRNNVNNRYQRLNGTAYQIYRNQTGSRLSLKEFIELVQIVQ